MISKGQNKGGISPDDMPPEPLTPKEQRANEIAVLLARGYSVSNINRAMIEKHKVNKSQISRAMKRARELLRESIDFDTKDLVAQQVARLENTIASEDRIIFKLDDSGEQHKHIIKGATYAEKTAAIAELNKLLGLHQPVKVAFTDTEGKSVTMIDIVQQVESNSRARVIDVAFIDTKLAALPAPKRKPEQGNGDERP